MSNSHRLVLWLALLFKYIEVYQSRWSCCAPTITWRKKLLHLVFFCLSLNHYCDCCLASGTRCCSGQIQYMQSNIQCFFMHMKLDFILHHRNSTYARSFIHSIIFFHFIPHADQCKRHIQHTYRQYVSILIMYIDFKQITMPTIIPTNNRKKKCLNHHRWDIWESIFRLVNNNW